MVSKYGPYAGNYQFDPDFTPPDSLRFDTESSGPGRGGGGLALPWNWLFKKKPIPPAAQVLGKLATEVVPAVIGRKISKSDDGGSAGLSPELQQLLQMSIKRMSQQQPLFDSINAQAKAGLPTAYQR